MDFENQTNFTTSIIDQSHIDLNDEEDKIDKSRKAGRRKLFYTSKCREKSTYGGCSLMKASKVFSFKTSNESHCIISGSDNTNTTNPVLNAVFILA